MDPIVTSAEMRELDRQTIEELGIPSRTLMEVAGREVARECLRYLKKPSHVVVVCGAGSNGGDGLVAARVLAGRGHHVRVFVFGDRKRIKTDAAAALSALEKTDESLIAF